MKDKVRFDRAIKALVKGFFNGTLAKGTCSACAVGNMVAESIGCKVKVAGILHPNSEWAIVFCTNQDGIQKINLNEYEGDAKGNIDSTGYSVRELARIEFSFERASKIFYSDYKNYTKDELMQDQYNGLMAVVEVLCEIEGIENVSEYKEMFAYKV